MLLRDLQSGATMEMILMPTVVAIVILSAHLAGQALRQGRLLSAAGLCVVAVLGAAITLTETMGRRAAVLDIAKATVSKSAYEASLLEADRDDVRRRITVARNAFVAECESGKGKKCDGAAATLRQLEATLSGLTVDAGQSPPVVADPRAARIVAIAGALGVPEANARTVYDVVMPFALPAVLELASIVLIGFGLGHRRVVTITHAPQPAATVPAPARIAPPAPSPRHDQIQAVLTALRSAGTPLCNQDLANAMHVVKSEASKRVDEAERAGLVIRRRHGREVSVALV